MKKFLIIAVLLLGVSCTTKVPETPTPTPVPSKPTETKPTVDLRAEIKEIVAAHPGCSQYKWKNRSVAPKAYLDGVALMYAKQVCGEGTNFINSNKIRSTWHYYGKDIMHDDSLEFYGIEGNALNTYTLLIGLGMRESSGRYGAGRDLSQEYTKSITAEAGLFQMSYNAKIFHEELDPLYFEFKNSKRKCELEMFKDERTSRVKSHEWKDYGTGEGAAWQNLMKKCPAASTAWAAILVRARMAHFGPLKRKEAEFRNECRDMLRAVEGIAKENCDQLK